MYVYTHILFLAPGPPMCLAVFSLPASLWYPKGAWIPYLTTRASIYEHSFFPYMCFRMDFFHVCVFPPNASMDSTLEPQGIILWYQLYVWYVDTLMLKCMNLHDIILYFKYLAFTIPEGSASISATNESPWARHRQGSHASPQPWHGIPMPSK
jgi:hypothetical protein